MRSNRRQFNVTQIGGSSLAARASHPRNIGFTLIYYLPHSQAARQTWFLCGFFLVYTDSLFSLPFIGASGLLWLRASLRTPAPTAPPSGRFTVIWVDTAPAPSTRWTSGRRARKMNPP